MFYLILTYQARFKGRLQVKSVFNHGFDLRKNGLTRTAQPEKFFGARVAGWAASDLHAGAFDFEADSNLESGEGDEGDRVHAVTITQVQQKAIKSFAYF